jgi:glycosyltransferase involved in cell wall biosynthesis
MTSPHLSIVIITLNEENTLPRLLQDLQRQSWTDFEIIHVDSNSTDNTVATSHAFSAQFEHYQVMEMEKRGVSLGRNMGARAASGQRLLFLDADTRLHPDFLRNSMFELELSKLAVAGVCMDGLGLPLLTRLGYGIFNAGIRASAYFYPTAVGACLFSTPEMHYSIGGFDERITLCDDCNYVLKAKTSNPDGFGILSEKFSFDPRRLQQDGLLSTGLVYLRANVRRFFLGELYQNEIPYQFGHYQQSSQG